MSVRETVNTLLFGGQHAAIITWIENLEKELEHYRKGGFMPETRYYTVTQEREVKVWANSPVEAAQVADRAFKDNSFALPDTVSGEATSPVRDRDIVVREDF